MRMPFTIKTTKNGTEIKMIDDAQLRAELQKAFKQHAPLFSEIASGVPSFDELKKTREVADFIETSYSAGETFTFKLRLFGTDKIIEKEVALVDENLRVRAISRWKAGEGITFVKTS